LKIKPSFLKNDDNNEFAVFSWRFAVFGNFQLPAANRKPQTGSLQFSVGSLQYLVIFNCPLIVS